tara:strand:- start:921 stop:1967 length:1047 start_codon:yes stop_codon:yes gene_type:complete
MSSLGNIHKICNKISINDDWSFDICGKKIIVAPYESHDHWSGKMQNFGSNKISGSTQKEKFLETLTSMIYQYFYSTGKVEPNIETLEKWGTFTPLPSEQSHYVHNLSSFNNSHSKPDPMWTVTSVNQESILAEKNHNLKVLKTGQYHLYDVNNQLQIGSKIHLIRQNQDYDIQPYFLYVYSNEVMDSNSELIRFYFNIDPLYTHTLIDEITKTGNQYHLPFTFKCLDHPNYYKCRSDAFVLYIDKNHHYLAWKVILKLYPLIKNHLNDEVSLFSYKIKDGIGFAEDPGNNQSFGLTRSAAVASLLIEASNDGNQLTNSRIQESFLNRGILADKMYLSIDSSTSYSFVK